VAVCLPLIDVEFLKLTTGADVSDRASTEALIGIVSSLIGEEFGGCVDPADASMRLKVICAEYTSFVMGTGSGGPATGLRAEQIGDYRVEYQSSNKADSFDLQVLRGMLASIHGPSAYTLTTMNDREPQPYSDALWDAVGSDGR